MLSGKTNRGFDSSVHRVLGPLVDEAKVNTHHKKLDFTIGGGLCVDKIVTHQKQQIKNNKESL